MEIKDQTPDEVIISFQKEEEDEDPDLSGKNVLKRTIKAVKDKIKKKAKAGKKKMQKIRLVLKIMIKKRKKLKKKKAGK